MPALFWITRKDGSTDSDLKPTANPEQAANGGNGFDELGLPAGDVFVAKLNAAGSALVYSTYLGGSGSDVGYGIAVKAKPSR